MIFFKLFILFLSTVLPFLMMIKGNTNSTALVPFNPAIHENCPPPPLDNPSNLECLIEQFKTQNHNFTAHHSWFGELYTAVTNSNLAGLLVIGYIGLVGCVFATIHLLTYNKLLLAPILDVIGSSIKFIVGGSGWGFQSTVVFLKRLLGGLTLGIYTGTNLFDDPEFKTAISDIKNSINEKLDVVCGQIEGKVNASVETLLITLQNNNVQHLEIVGKLNLGDIARAVDELSSVHSNFKQLHCHLLVLSEKLSFLQVDVDKLMIIANQHSSDFGTLLSCSIILAKMIDELKKTDNSDDHIFRQSSRVESLHSQPSGSSEILQASPISRELTQPFSKSEESPQPQLLPSHEIEEMKGLVKMRIESYQHMAEVQTNTNTQGLKKVIEETQTYTEVIQNLDNVNTNARYAVGVNGVKGVIDSLDAKSAQSVLGFTSEKVASLVTHNELLDAANKLFPRIAEKALEAAQKDAASGSGSKLLDFDSHIHHGQQILKKKQQELAKNIAIKASEDNTDTVANKINFFEFFE